MSDLAPSLSDTAPPATAHAARRWGLLLIKIGLSLALLWFLVRHTKFSLADLMQANPRYLAAALFLLVLQPVLIGFRWRVILRGLGAKLAPLRAIAITFISVFFNLFLPASVGGDLIRIWYAGRNQVQTKPAVSSVLMDRLLALLVLLGMIVVVLPFASSIITDQTVLNVLRLLGLAGVIGSIALLYADRLLRPWQHHRWAQMLAWPSRAACQILTVWSTAWRCISLSLAVHIITCVAVALIAQAYGASLPLGALFLLVPPVVLALTLPISLGGWGVREAAMVAALGGIGVDGQTAFLIALMLGLLMSLASLPGLIFWMVYRNKKRPV